VIWNNRKEATAAKFNALSRHCLGGTRKLWELVDGGLLGCDAVWTCRWVPTFQRNIQPPYESWRWKEYVPPKRWYPPTSSQSVTIQETTIDSFTAVRTSNHYGNQSDSFFWLILILLHLQNRSTDFDQIWYRVNTKYRRETLTRSYFTGSKNELHKIVRKLIIMRYSDTRHL
jgi:hypothetical protein